ncbi:shikimate dehydrogenase [Cognatazoarcus halotolerans]|uniref:shikimate dehydrogenase n=1 Tax=Cognatazoarcus halotolerans TaxID=2686016 RepID=UPI00135B4194|nr:shikimate dehydrogenase [Cognatazoarcus halotolerans]
MDRYAVIGNPIAHSKSPRIHAEFAHQTGQRMSYEAILAPVDGFAAAAAAFREAGGLGMNVTVPFKLDAHAFTDDLSVRARAAGAVNTLVFGPDGRCFGDNTDGAGLVQDITVNLGVPLEGRRILLLGAGGAARGVILPLLGRKPAGLFVANRTESRANDLLVQFSPAAGNTRLDAGSFAALAGRQFDVVINATAASLADEAPAIPAGLHAPGALAYDMMYGRGDTPFLAAARKDGAGRFADGLGMLVEQAAESFALWRRIRPDTAPVLTLLRAELTAG